MDIMMAIKAINQAAADAYRSGDDGIKSNREEVTAWIKDKRVIDGFGIKIQGDVLEIRYHTELTAQEVAEEDLNKNLEKNLKDFKKFLSKQFKKSTGNELRLKSLGDMDGIIESVSPTRSWAKCTLRYKIQNYNIEIGDHENILKESNENKEQRMVDASDWRSMAKKFLDEGKKERMEAIYSNESPWLTGIK